MVGAFSAAFAILLPIERICIDFHAAKRARADQAQQRGPSHLREETYLERMLGIRR
jgi:hypothetical protein